MSRVLDGRAAAESIRREVASGVERMVAGGKPAPCLAVVLVGENPASLVYVRSKVRACEEAGLLTQEHRLPANASQATLLKVVHDLGVDTSADKFIEAVEETKAPLLGMSALLTTTMPNMGKTIEAFIDADLRDEVKIMVGGAPVTQDFADDMGADGYGKDALACVALAKNLLGVVARS